MEPLQKRWTLLGASSSYLIVRCTDEAAADRSRHVSPLVLNQQLERWMTSHRQMMVEIDASLWGSASDTHSRDKRHDEKLKQRLLNAFRAGWLVALERERPAPPPPKPQDNPFRGLSTEQRAAKIRALMAEWLVSSRTIVQVFQSCESVAEFIELQAKLDMTQVLEELGDWQTLQVGALGPVEAGRDALNQKRADYILRAIREYSHANAQVFILYMFNNMYGDDIHDVLNRLVGDKRLSQTLVPLEAVQKNLEARGILLTRYTDREFKASDVLRGLGAGIGDLLSSGELARGAAANRYYSEKGTLPKEYSDVLDAIEKAQLQVAFTPGNLLLGIVDYVTLGVPLGLYHLATGTAHALKELVVGDAEQGIRELVPALLLVMSTLGVKGLASKRKADASTPQPSNQFVLKGYTGPLSKEAARLGALLQLGTEAQGAAGLLLERYGTQGVSTVSAYMRANSKVARLIHQHGLPAIDALLEAKGDLGKARARMARQLPQTTATLLAQREATVQAMEKANVMPKVAREALGFAQKVGLEQQLIELVGSRRLVNMDGLRNFLSDLHDEMRAAQKDGKPRNGLYNEFKETHHRAVEQGHEVSLGGRKRVANDPRSGDADVIDHTAREALQVKTVSGAKVDAVIKNLQKAVDQLGGQNKEVPPVGYQLIADIRLEAGNELYTLTRSELLPKLRGKIKGLEQLLPANTPPGVVKITNKQGTFTFTPVELR